MEVRDGFIVGIFNYCDRWCARCVFTSHCRLFADHVAIEASLDPNLKEVADAPSLPEDVPPPPPGWIQELIEELNEAVATPHSPEEWQRMQPRVPPELEPIHARANEYERRTAMWLTASELHSARNRALDVISWFRTMIPAKVYRSIATSPDDDSEDGGFDRDGSAKVALQGIDESHVAWLELAEHGVIGRREADSFIADLVWLGEALERARPNARAFIRPAFDEPDAVAGFLARNLS